MLTQIWHAKKPSFGMTPQSWPNDYELIAEIDSKSLEVAFEKTNTIEQPWWVNEGILGLIVHKRTRSTSVGDVVVIDGQAHLCENAGWTHIQG